MLGAEVVFAFHGALIKRDAEIFERKRMKQIWLAILQRCNNPRSQPYRFYGGRGIKCTIRSFSEFFEHMGSRPSPAHSLDRIDVDGHYAIGNLRWATRDEQRRNQRNSHLVEFHGVVKSIKEWSASVPQVAESALRHRVRRGWSIERALTAPKTNGGEVIGAIRRAQTHCKYGHEFTEENTYRYYTRRVCRKCAADKQRKWRKGRVA